MRGPWLQALVVANQFVVWVAFAFVCEPPLAGLERFIPAFLVAALLSSIAVLFAFGIEFGWGETAPNKFRYVFVVLVTSICVVCRLVLAHVAERIPLLSFMEFYDLPFLLVWFFLPFWTRGLPYFLMQHTVLVFIWDGGLSMLPTGLAICIAINFSCHAVYIHDQWKAYYLVICAVVPIQIGSSVKRCVSQTEARFASLFVWFTFGFLAIHRTMIFCRTKRYLPKGLAGVKFVSWRYLRAMAARGDVIKRCQDLPTFAFGDVGKAWHVVGVSHRWFNSKTSDLVTETFPLGVKLTIILQRLDEHFWPKSMCSRKPMTVSTSDVLLFVDFMSLPQEGIDEDGNVIHRTAAEQAVFDACLPYMGTLYSLFPVLVLADLPVAPNLYHEYHESGWCLCEFTIASMGKQLHWMSADSMGNLKRSSIVQIPTVYDLNGASATSFLSKICSHLQEARFSRESDRDVTIGIVSRFLVKRMLVDAVWSNSISTVRQLLGATCIDDKETILNEPLDRDMNTLLHIAVRTGDALICLELLRHGAQSALLNIFGDTPTRRTMLPRRCLAARVVRAYRNGALLEAEHLAGGEFATCRSDIVSENALERVFSGAQPTIRSPLSKSNGAQPTIRSALSKSNTRDFLVQLSHTYHHDVESSFSREGNAFHRHAKS